MMLRPEVDERRAANGQDRRQEQQRGHGRGARRKRRVRRPGQQAKESPSVELHQKINTLWGTEFWLLQESCPTPWR